ncbi:MAG: glycosyltransferase [Thermomicrobiales bacterium]
MSARRTGQAFALAFALAQGALAGRVFLRMARSAGGNRVRRVEPDGATEGPVSLLIPVLNEIDRLASCLEGAIAQDSAITEILVVDGGSTDGTQRLVERFATQDPRIRLIDAAPVPAGINGKAFGLETGLRRSDSRSRWVLTLDADVTPHPDLARSLVAHAGNEGVCALSIATRQRLSGAAEGPLHPAMLTTLVYRFGIPGHATDRLADVQANGQCMLIDREALDAVGGFETVLSSINEDVTLARAIAASGRPVGFYESDDLVSVQMYAGWRDAWRNWTRSLPMRDRYVGRQSDLGLAEILCVQALPPWIAVAAWRFLGQRHPLTLLNLGLSLARIGVLQGTARAYSHRPWTYWLSPLADVPVALKLIVMSRQRRHHWRGRTIMTGGT